MFVNSCQNTSLQEMTKNKLRYVELKLDLKLRHSQKFNKVTVANAKGTLYELELLSSSGAEGTWILKGMRIPV